MNATGGIERRAISTVDAPPPAGSYSQAIAAGGFVFLSGQTPRLADGTRMNDAAFATQARLALDNLAALGRAAGTELSDAAMVTVYLRDTGRAAEFDAIYRTYVREPYPARAIVQSDLPGFEIEISAVVCL